MKNAGRHFVLHCILLCFLAVCLSRSAAQEVVTANIASRSFDVLLRTAEAPNESRLEIFRDGAGTLPAGELIVSRQALFSGSTEGDDYERRCADRLLRAAMTEAGNTLFRVENAEPDTAYYLRLVYDGQPWPAEGLHEIRTVPSGEWRSRSHQLIVDISRPGGGWVGTLSVNNSASPLLAVCGDGVPADSALFFNLADLTDAAGNPVSPPPGEPMQFRLYGKTGSPAADKTLLYSPPVSDDSVAAFGTEVAPLLRLLVASAVEGISDPPSGEQFLFDGNQITCRLTQSVISQDGTQFVSYGWSGTGSVPVSGRQAEFTFTLTVDSTLDWNWRTNFWVEVVSDAGAVDLSSGWYRSGSQLTASVVPHPEWIFREWSGLGSGADLITAFTLSEPGTLAAVFDPVLVPGGGGMPEWWLTQAGLAGADRNPAADPDRDGMSNLQEWIADTRPDDPGSALRILSAEKTAGQVNLVWQGGRESRQIVETLEGTLAGGAWQAVATNLPPTDIIGECIIQIADEPARFFRIRAER